MLEFLLARLGGVPWPHRVVVATSTSPEDDPLEALGRRAAVDVHRGPLHDVLRRYLGAVEGDPSPWMFRVTSDCPFLDLDLLDHLHARIGDDLDYARMDPAGLPLGLAAELVRTEALRRLEALGPDPEEREHVTLGLYRRPEMFRIQTVSLPPGYPLAGSPLRLTLDEAADHAVLAAAADALGPGLDAGRLRAFYDAHPTLARGNLEVRQHYPAGFWEAFGGHPGLPQAVLFDLDGTLVDSHPLLRARFDALVATLGLDRDSLDFRRFDGMRLPEIVAALSRGQGPEAGEAYLEDVRRAYAEEVPGFPGVDAMLRGLRASGVHLALVTAAGRHLLEVLLPRLGWEDLFVAVVSGDDVGPGKPAPDGYRLALERLGLPAGACLAVEDSVSGTQAARGAGLEVVGIAPASGRAALEQAGAAPVLESAAELPGLLAARPGGAG